MDQTLLEVRVTKKTLEADDIASFELKNCDGSSLPHFSAGPHVDVNMANGLVRPYSLCNVPGETDSYKIGRASCRARVCPSGSLLVDTVCLKKKTCEINHS